MYSNKDFAILIPARAGSKGIKNKNIYPCNGKPLIQYTIDSALKSKIKKDVYVSTDSKKIATLSESLGAKAPYLRSPQLGKDNISTIDVIFEFIDLYPFYKHIVLLQPTSPLRKSFHIDKAINLYLSSKSSSLVSTKKTNLNKKYFFKYKKKYLKINKVVLHERRQEVQEEMYPNGAIYISSYKNIIKNKSFFVKKTAFFEMDQTSSIDIDNLEDLKLVESILKIK